MTLPTTVVLAFLVHLVLADGPPHDVGDGGGDQAEMDFYAQSKQTGETGVSVRCSRLSFIQHSLCPRSLDIHVLGDPEVTANLYCNFAYPYWEGCVICSIYLR